MRAPPTEWMEADFFIALQRIQGPRYSIRAGANAIRPIFAVSWRVSRDAKEGTMVHTYGLTHINLVVRDVARSLRFYGQVFGVEE